jgi:hypothetical protein
MFDAWPRFHKRIAENAKTLKIRLIFFSSKEASRLFNQLQNEIRGVWIPEGIDVNDYYFKPYELKVIDVLEFGRKYDLYHDKIASTLSDRNYKHLFEQQKGTVVFKSRVDFLNGLSESKISICIPSSITHPERSEGLSSMTLRYLQSMASKCLIVGILPKEMKELFTYMPIVEIDMSDPQGQILEVLSAYESYIPLIERNYKVVHESHTWEVRINKMLEIIKNESEY